MLLSRSRKVMIAAAAKARSNLWPAVMIPGHKRTTFCRVKEDYLKKAKAKLSDGSVKQRRSRVGGSTGPKTLYDVIYEGSTT